MFISKTKSSTQICCSSLTKKNDDDDYAIHLMRDHFFVPLNEYSSQTTLVLNASDGRNDK
jgi:hypothetical protein